MHMYHVHFEQHLQTEWFTKYLTLENTEQARDGAPGVACGLSNVKLQKASCAVVHSFATA